MQLIITELFLSTVQFAFGSHSRQLPPGAVGLSGSSRDTASDCFFFFSDSQIRAEADGAMLREMKACCPGLLVAFCIINMFFAILSFSGNALVVLTIAFFSELHEITANNGLASLAASSLFHGTVLNSILFALGVNALFDDCPIFLSFRFSVFYFCHTLALNSLFNLCIVTAERYIAVTFPLRYFSILPKKRMVKLITLAWLNSFFISIPCSID